MPQFHLTDTRELELAHRLLLTPAASAAGHVNRNGKYARDFLLPMSPTGDA